MIEETLKRTFGFETFKPGQRQVIEKITAGNSAASIFPTGAGKSLCYQLPAILEQGMTLVVSPLLSLMKNQIDFLESKHIPAAKLDSGMSARDYRETLEAARTGQLKILMIAVERFKNERFRTQLRQMNVSLLVVDEAHCISEWGHNFRPDYLKIPLYQKEFGIKKALLLTATATPAVIDDMCEKFAVSRENVVKTGFYRKNLFLRIRPVAEEKKDALLQEVLAGKPAGPAIVYVTLQKTANRISRMLKDNGLDVAAYHAGMKHEDREAVQNDFMAGKTRTVVATIAFGMGIDKDNIRKVIHYDLPKSIEGYSQEIGRAGRDGNPSLCCLFGNKNGVPVLENFAYGDTPDLDGIRQVLEDIRQCKGNLFEFRPYTVSRKSDIRLLPLKTLLVYLEMASIMSPKYTYFEIYAFKYLIPAQAIIDKFNGERAQFVKTILDNSKTARTWTQIDIDKAVDESGSDRQRVLTALEYFHEKKWIDLQPKSAVEVFEIRNSNFDLASTARELTDLFLEKEKKEIARLHAMVDFFETDQCLAKGLSGYFGERLDNNCQRCSVCLEKKPVKLLSSPVPSLESMNYPALVQPLLDTAETPVSVTLATRFLCGISSPRLVEYKARQMPGFGRLEAWPYKSVEKWVRRIFQPSLLQ
ncbi:MAG: RecQ family ATP-dependent DNA helicase [Desulfotignum sp.]|nr:RecQ family ATP-dependent DNA helicase [Desulfotignum sp.]MCF8137567.1 RecQ family ATP-dependent DNA helicase [Desulfotignum sp.]